MKKCSKGLESYRAALKMRYSSLGRIPIRLLLAGKETSRVRSSTCRVSSKAGAEALQILDVFVMDVHE